MKLKYILFIFILITAASSSFATSYTWVGTTSSWNLSSNWSPSGIPDSADNVTISSGTNGPLLDQARKITNLTLSSKTIDLNGYSLTVYGTATMTSGTVTNGTFYARGNLASFNGTLMDCPVDAICGYIRLSGSTFNEIADFTDLGAATGTGSGGCTFNDDVTITHTGTLTYFTLANTTGDTFNGNVTFTNNSNREIHIASSGTTLFNGNVILNSTSSGGISFANSGGIATLASGKTISIGSSGFAADFLTLKNFTQNGSTDQTLTLTGTAVVNMIGATFNGNLTVTAPGILLKNNTFNGTTTLTRNGSSGNHQSDGGNTFNTLTLDNAGSAGRVRWATTTPDIYNGNVTFNSTGGQDVQIAYSGDNLFAGNITINSNKVVFNTASGKVTFSGGNAQTLNGSYNFPFKKLAINKSANQVTANTSLSVDDTLFFVSKNLITTSTNLLTMKAGSVASGASNSSFVSGPIKKVGNTAFLFPTGGGNEMRLVGISAPNNVTDAFTAEYINVGQSLGNSMDTTVNTISDCGYWNLSRNTGSANITPKFAFDSTHCDYIFVKPVHIMHWNGTKWIDKGEAISDGAAKKTNAVVTSYGSFAFAYKLEIGDACRYSDILTPDTILNSVNKHLKNETIWFEFQPDSIFTEINLKCPDSLKNYSNIKSVTVYQGSQCHALTIIESWNFPLNLYQNKLSIIASLNENEDYYLLIERYGSNDSCFVCDADSTFINIGLRNIVPPANVISTTLNNSHNKDLFGYNGSNIIRTNGLESTQMFDAIKDNSRLFPGNLRYPAGTIGNWWNWRTGWFFSENELVDFHLPNSYVNATNNFDNKLTQLKKYNDELGISTSLVLNLLTSDLPFQLASIAESHSLNIPVSHFELGNEFYLDDDEYLTRFPTVAFYADIASEWATSLKATFGSSSKVAVVGATIRPGLPSFMRRNLWLGGLVDFMDNNIHEIDAITLHHYIGTGLNGNNFPQNSIGPAETIYDQLFAEPFVQWARLNDNDGEIGIIKSLSIDPEIWITEFNIFDKENNHKIYGSWAHGLLASSMLLNYLEEESITKINLHSLVGDASFAALFNVTDGLENLGLFPDPITTPPTIIWNKSALGNAIAPIAQTIRNTTSHEKIIFNSTLPTLASNFPGVVGWLFEGPESFEAIILRLDYPGPTNSFSGVDISGLQTIANTNNYKIERFYQENIDYAITPEALGYGIPGNASNTSGIDPILHDIIQGQSSSFIALFPYSITKLVFDKPTTKSTITVSDSELCSTESTGVYVHGRNAGLATLSLTNTNCNCTATSNSSIHSNEYVTTVTCATTTSAAGTCTISIDNETKIINVHPPLATANFTFPTSTIEPSTPITLEEPSHTFGNYIWVTETSGKNFDGQYSHTTDFTIEKTTEFTLYYSDAGGNCWNSISNTVEVCKADAGVDRFICGNQPGDDVQIGTPDILGLTYTWTPPNSGLSSYSIDQPVAKPNSTQTYTLTVTNGMGCTSTDEVTVNVIVDCCTGSGNYSSEGETNTSEITTSLGTNNINGQEIYLNGVIILDNIINFTDCDIFMGTNAKIVGSGPGRAITFNESRISSCTSQMWDGIYLSNPSQSITINNNSTLNDCKNCITTSREANVTCVESTFGNFNKAFVFTDYDLPADILITENAFNGSTNLPSPFSGLETECIISIDDVKEITIGDLSSNENEFNTAKIGILGINSDIYVKNNDFSAISENSIKTSNVSSFDLRLWPANSVEVTSNEFSNCISGINSSNMNCAIFNNTMNSVDEGINAIGGWAKTIDISGNTILDAKTGINVFSHRDNISITSNPQITINSNGIAGISVNGVMSETGRTEVLDNVIDSEGIFGVLVRSAYYNLTAENDINLNHTSASLSYGVMLEDGVFSNIQCNDIDGLSPLGQKAISASFSGQSSYYCNSLDESNMGMEFISDCSGSELKGNKFHNLIDGIVLGMASTPSTIGDQIDPNFAESPGNEFRGSGSGIFTNSALNSIDSDGTEFWISGTFPFSLQAGMNVATPINNGSTTAFQVVNPVLTEYDCSEINCTLLRISEDITEISAMELIAQKRINNDSTTTDALNHSLIYSLQSKIKENPELLENDILESFYDSIEVTPIGQILLINDKINEISNQLENEDEILETMILECREINSSFTPINIIESNYKAFFTIYLNYLVVENYNLVPEDKSIIESIAFQCPYTGGRIVYQARSLMSIWDQRQFDDDAICSNSFRLAAQVKANINNSEFRVYPNPSSGLTVFESDEKYLDGNILIYDFRGSLVESIKYTGNKTFYEFSHQPSGLYYFQFYDCDRLLYSGKISLIKTN